MSGLADPNAEPKDFAEDANPFGFQVRVTANVSMMQDIFMITVSSFVITYLRDMERAESLIFSSLTFTPVVGTSHILST